MKVEKLTLRNFRNIRECYFYPDGRLNFLIGKNGQGKTSVVEALGFLSLLRSFRGSKSAEVISFGENFSEILCTLRPDPDAAALEIKIIFTILDLEHTKASKQAWINGKTYRSSTQFLSQRFGQFELGFHSIVFNPSDHELIRGEPSRRRLYLDQVLSAETAEHLEIIQKYKKVLEQRNSLLKQESFNRAALASFTEPLVYYGARVALARLSWIERLNPRLSEISKKIAPGQLPLEMVYQSHWTPQSEAKTTSKNLDFTIKNERLDSNHFAGHWGVPSLEQLENGFWKRLADLESAERRSGNTLVGPHRDDWMILIGNQVLKGHGSQGEVRSALLALKLAEIELFRKQTGHRPILLLDDFSSELDLERRSHLLEFLINSDLQVFVTSTEDFTTLGKFFRVSEGQIQEYRAVGEEPVGRKDDYDRSSESDTN